MHNIIKDEWMDAYAKNEINIDEKTNFSTYPNGKKISRLGIEYENFKSLLHWCLQEYF